MNELEQRVKTLETKVKLLEETLVTLKNINLSEQMESYIQTRSRSLKMIDLLNSIDHESHLDFDKERETLNNVRVAKNTVDAQISQALRSSATFSDNFPNDPHLFNYEVETGKSKKTLCYNQEKNLVLAKYAGKGIRITAYNGFEDNSVIIPTEIDGYPVVSIGENVFMNTSVSKVILPKSIKIILDSAFEGCKNLKHIDLPDTLEYLGDSCFAQSGLTELAFPNSLKLIPPYCCRGCQDLANVSVGQRVNKIDFNAFSGCVKISDILLPESLSEIDSGALNRTSIKTIIFPSKMTRVSNDVFNDRYGTYLKAPLKVTCVFFGKDTSVYSRLENVSLIYCLSGSKIQQMAREYSIPMKPLSEFRMEDYQ